MRSLRKVSVAGVLLRGAMTGNTSQAAGGVVHGA